MEKVKTVYLIVGVLLSFGAFPLLGIFLDLVFFESFRPFTWILFFLGIILFKNSFKKISSSEIGGALIFGEYINDLNKGINYVFLGFLNNSIVRFPNKVITMDTKTQEVTYIDHSHDEKRELDPLDLFSYPYEIDISLSVKIVNAENFFSNTGIYTLDIDYEFTGKYSWEKNIIANIKSTFETIGSFLGYPEMKIKSDWNEYKIKKAIEKHGDDFPDHKVSETLPETLRSFGIEITDINTTASLSKDMRDIVASIYKKDQEMKARKVEALANLEIAKLQATAEAEKEAIRMKFQREILKETVADMLANSDGSLTKAMATENAMIIMNSFNDEQVFRLSGTDGNNLKALESMIIAYLSKNSGSSKKTKN